jgi:hypothetical protein
MSQADAEMTSGSQETLSESDTCKQPAMQAREETKRGDMRRRMQPMSIRIYRPYVGHLKQNIRHRMRIRRARKYSTTNIAWESRGQQYRSENRSRPDQ